jgi:hypothetical protein
MNAVCKWTYETSHPTRLPGDSVRAMATDNGLPAAVERLLRDDVPSVASVELLLVLREAGTRPQGVGEIAAAAGCPPRWAMRELERLRRRGLVRGDETTGWTFVPASRDVATSADQLARLWYSDRRAITRWLFAHRSRRTASRH